MRRARSKDSSALDGGTSSFPFPKVDSVEQLNQALAKHCRADLTRTLRGRSGSKEQLLQEEQPALLPLPQESFEASRVTQVPADSLSLVAFDSNRYSVPVKHVHRSITVVATVGEVKLIDGDRLIARHARSWKKHQDIFESVHYVALLDKKPGGFEHAMVTEVVLDCFLTAIS